MPERGFGSGASAPTAPGAARCGSRRPCSRIRAAKYHGIDVKTTARSFLNTSSWIPILHF